jgi:hypothetical protein
MAVENGVIDVLTRASILFERWIAGSRTFGAAWQ